MKGCRTYQLQTFQPQASTPDLSTLDFSTMNFSTRLGVGKSGVEKSGVEKIIVEKSLVEKSGVGNFMVEKSGVERSGVKAWGWNVLQQFEERLFIILVWWLHYLVKNASSTIWIHDFMPKLLKKSWTVSDSSVRGANCDIANARCVLSQ